MINLLPPEEKEKFLLEKKGRILITLWFLVLFFLLCSVLILFSIKIYLQGQVDSQKAFLVEAEKEAERSEIKGLREKIKSANLTLAKLNSFYRKKIYSPGILEKISRTLPPGIYLTNLSVVFSLSGKEPAIKVSLSGFAPTTESLFEFKKNLEKEPDFKEVYFPPANWVKPADINFFVTSKIDIK